MITANAKCLSFTTDFGHVPNHFTYNYRLLSGLRLFHLFPKVILTANDLNTVDNE